MKDKKIEIKIMLVNYEETIEKLENIKKLLQEIGDINVQVKGNYFETKKKEAVTSSLEQYHSSLVASGDKPLDV